MTTQNPDDIVQLVLRNSIDHLIGQSLRVEVSRRDLELVEPILQRLMRNGLNPRFNFEVKEVVPKE
jgi:hypothetical protein